MPIFILEIDLLWVLLVSKYCQTFIQCLKILMCFVLSLIHNLDYCEVKQIIRLTNKKEIGNRKN